MGRYVTAIRTGIDQVIAGDVSLARTGRASLLSNRASRSSHGDWSGDALADASYPIEVLLAPEHGLDATVDAGETVPHSSMREMPVLSLYGADMAPVEARMTALDRLIIDLSDVGARYYTYGWTVLEALKLAERHDLVVTVLDRPNPLGGAAVEGNTPENVDSPVCSSPVPVRHGLTMGELALWNRRIFDLNVEIEVVKLTGWRRTMLWEETRLPWVPPSPALRTPSAAMAYPGTCLLEGTNVSEARGTGAPFLAFGAPFIDGEALRRDLSGRRGMDGSIVEPIAFTPTSSKWEGQRCQGVGLEIVDRATFHPVRAGIAIVAALRSIPGFAFLAAHFDALAGTPSWREALEAEVSPEEIAEGWRADETQFREVREVILLYA